MGVAYCGGVRRWVAMIRADAVSYSVHSTRSARTPQRKCRRINPRIGYESLCSGFQRLPSRRIDQRFEVAPKAVRPIN